MMQSNQTFTLDDFSQRKIVQTIIFSSGFLLAKNHVLRVLIVCTRQLLLIKTYVAISKIFKKVHHLLKLWATNKEIKKTLLLLFLNFLTGNQSSLTFQSSKLKLKNSLIKFSSDWCNKKESLPNVLHSG